MIEFDDSAEAAKHILIAKWDELTKEQKDLFRASRNHLLHRGSISMEKSEEICKHFGVLRKIIVLPFGNK